MRLGSAWLSRSNENRARGTRSSSPEDEVWSLDHEPEDCQHRAKGGKFKGEPGDGSRPAAACRHAPLPRRSSFVQVQPALLLLELRVAFRGCAVLVAPEDALPSK